MSLKKFTSGERLLASDLNSMVTQIEANIPMVETTWSELKTLRDNSQLVPGTTYRITDYNCTTSKQNTSSAGHVFDILVTADDVNVLNENAHAIQHSGDTYFQNSDLSAWELKYCLDNDDTRFAWAVTGETGRGVIYYMKDEWSNECPYDFKNILFTSSYPAQYTNMYTFCMDTSTTDASINGYSNGVYNNSISPYVNSNKQQLNYIVFIGSNNYSNVLLDNCHDIKFGYSCYYNTFGNNCKYNVFGNYFQYNTCGENVLNIKFTTNYTTGDNYLLRYLHILNGYAYNGTTAVPTGITMHAEFPQFIGYNSSKVFTVKKPLD